MRLLIIGKNGQVAQSLVERAGRVPGLDVQALGRDAIDLERPGSIAPAIAAAAPDVVINAAAFTAADAAEDEEARALAVNAAGAGEAARASAAAGARFIHLSTDYVFDGTGTAARDETAPTGPLGVYGRSKLAGEKAVRAADPGALILRTAWVYSPFGHNFVRTMMRAARDRDELRVVADQRGSPTSALDLGDAILAAARAGGEGLFHVAGTGSASWAELAQAVRDECGRLGLPTARIVPIPTSDYPTPARRPMNSMLDSGRFAQRFGFTMPDWRVSLRAVVKRLASV